MQKDFKIFPYNENDCVSFNLLLVLLPPEQSLVLKKNYDKKNLVEISGSKHSKIVFVLLNKIVIVYVEVIFIYVWYSSFEKYLLELIKVL